MICPTCGAEQDPSPECVRCGLIFGKYRGERPARGRSPSGRLRARPGRHSLPWGRLLAGTLAAATLLLAVSWFMKDRYPLENEILPDLLQEPVQAAVERPPFTAEAGGVRYTIRPLYTYEIRGMVVSQHDCGAWWDIYHHDLWKDFINLKDLCVIWGRNLESGVYRDMGFRNDSWTCSWSWPDAETGARFLRTGLSNNHLLCTDDTLRERIRRTSPGDQVWLRGTLAEYSHGHGAFHRGTSTRRDDTGNGACETIFVEDYEILRPANPGWRAVYRLSGFAALGALLLLAIRFGRSLLRA